MNNAGKQQAPRVAEVKLGDFSLGSVESRAAARMIAEKIANRHKLVRRIVFIPTGLEEAKRKSLAGAQCFRRVEGADEITEFWHWEDQARSAPAGSGNVNLVVGPKRISTASPFR